ncbi:MAG: pitrilysin family protein [Bryobacteraceae bacterium]
MARPSGIRIPVSVDHCTQAAVRRTVLPNGIRVITDTTAAGGNAAAITILIECGARHERQEEHGLANLAAQVSLQGTVTRGALETARELERFRAGVAVDADHSCFQAAIAGGKAGPGPVEDALHLLADLITNATCYDEAIQMERAALESEIAMAAAAPARHTRALLRSAVWRDHVLGRPLIGSGASLRALDRRRLLRFIEQHYRAGSIVVAAAGAVEHDRIANAAADAFRQLGPSEPIPWALPKPVWHSDALHKRANTPESHFAIGLPAVEYGHALSASFRLLDRVTGGGTHSRLYRRLKIEQNLVRRIRSSYQPYADTGIWMIEGSATPEKEGQAVAAILEELHSFGGARPVTEEELWLAARELNEAQQTAARDLSTRAKQAAFCVSANVGPVEPAVPLPLESRQAAETDALARRTLPVWLPELGLARFGPFHAGTVEMDAGDGRQPQPRSVQ